MKNHLLLYGLLLLILSFNLSSHSHGYWPGDIWLLRSLYWLGRFLLELILFYSCFQLIAQYFIAKPWRHFFASIFISSLPFTLAAAMLDIATGRPDTYPIMVELEKTGAIGPALVMEWLETLPRHLAFCALLFFIDQCLNPPRFKQKFATHSPETTPQPPANNQQPMPPFMRKFSTKNIGEPMRIQAQEHYISITTQTATKLIQYRFGLAIQELENLPGRQVHRSFWVADNNVKGWRHQEPGISLQLHFGEPVSVSRRFEDNVKQYYPEITTL